MKGLGAFLCTLGALWVQASAEVNLTTAATSSLRRVPKPPQVWRDVNLVRSINLEKGYPRETINVVIENTDSKAQSEYYLPFDSLAISLLGGFEVRDKNHGDLGRFEVEAVQLAGDSSQAYYRIQLPAPLDPKKQQTLSITYSVRSSVSPVPATISQIEKQYLVYHLNAYHPSLYPCSKQKTKLKAATADIPDYTKHTVTGDITSENKQDPVVQGTTVTYGPFDKVPAGAELPIRIRYEFTAPVNVVTSLERDIEVSHWGGNLATEERYWYTNAGAELKEQFSRVLWTTQSYYGAPSSALKEFRIPLKGGAMDPYFIDDVGNVSTSRWRPARTVGLGPGAGEGTLELKPRYPVFGGWNYKFKIGWDRDLKSALRKLKTGEEYVLKVPFIEGPKNVEGTQYHNVKLRVLLPEGASDIRFSTNVPIASESRTTHHSFMDTVGRSVLELTAVNLNDAFRDMDLIVVYKYPATAGLRKPLTVMYGVFAVFGVSWVLGNVDTRIKARG